VQEEPSSKPPSKENDGEPTPGEIDINISLESNDQVPNLM
jgi:hypothetical protein